MKTLWLKQNWVAKSGGVAKFRHRANFFFQRPNIYIYIYICHKRQKSEQCRINQKQEPVIVQVANFRRLRNFCILPSTSKINTRKFLKKCKKIKINLKTNIN